MRILCVIDSLGSGGAQRQIVRLALAFKETGIDVSVLVYHDYDFFKEDLTLNNIPVVCISPSNYLKRILKIRYFIRKGKYDCVLSFLETPNFICELAGLPYRRWKLIVGERSANPHLTKSFRRRIFRWLHYFADYVVANSYQNIQMVKSINPLLPKRKCRVIYNLIDMERWKVNKPNELNRNDKLRIVIAASHQYVKNLKGLIQGVNMLSEHDKNKFVIEWYGDESGDQSLVEGKKLIAKYELKNIFFYPATSDIMQKMQKADLVGLFSLYEGLPNAICEGMALGKAVICSAVSDLPLILSDSKEFLVDPYNYESISAGLKYILTLSAESLIEEGCKNKAKALRLFSKDNIVRQYLDLLSKTG